MLSSSRLTLGLLIVLIVWCQTESFLVNTAVTNGNIRHKAKANLRITTLRSDSFTRIRGGKIEHSAKSLFETIPKSAFAKNLVAVLHTFVDPAITGGFLSGGLHAITGTHRYQ